MTAFLNIIKYRSERRDIGLCRIFIKCNITWNEYLATSLAPCNDFKKKFSPNYVLIFKQNRFNTVDFFYLHDVYFIHFRNAA